MVFLPEVLLWNGESKSPQKQHQSWKIILLPALQTLSSLYTSFQCSGLGSTNIYATTTNPAELLEQNCEPAYTRPPWALQKTTVHPS